MPDTPGLEGTRIMGLSPRLLACAALLICGLAVLATVGQAQGSALRLEMPEQNLASSLRAVAARFGLNILFSEVDVRGRTAPALHGEYSAASAYEALLKGTSLMADFGEHATVIIRARQPPERRSSHSSSDDEEELGTPAETVVVTGRAGVEAQLRADTSYSISVISQEQLRESGASSVADSIRMTPGFWVENSGGEASANVRARGIPLEGFGSIQVAEDGLPVQHDPALGYLNVDQSFRLDESIAEIQVVRGGPSSIFSSNAPGGLVNYLTRKPGTETQGVLKLTLGDDGLYRTDGWIGTAFGDSWRASVSGFYRIERGVRDPGYNFNKGGQFRVSLGHDIGRGTIDLDYKRIADNVGFYTDLPMQLAGNRVLSLPGLDATTGILNGPETESLRARTLTGPMALNLADGTAVRLDQVTAHLVQENGDWHVADHLRLRSTNQERIGLFPGSVQDDTVRLSQLLPEVQALYPAALSVQFRYVDAPTVASSDQNGNGLEVDAAIRQVRISERELMNDLRFSRKLRLGGRIHDVSIGAYLMSADESFTRYTAVAFADVENHARLMDVVALDSNGRIIGTATEHGLIRYGAEFADGSGKQQTGALYAADEWQLNDAVRVDLGTRAEWMHTSGSSEGATTVNLGQTSTLADKAYLTGNGVYTPYNQTFFAPTWTAGVNWQLHPTQGMFARVTSAKRLPSISDFITSPNNSAVVNRMQMYELGLKLNSSWFETYATLFDTEYHDYSVTEAVYDKATKGIVLQNYYANTRDWGVELEGTFRPERHFELDFGATVQRPVYTSLKYTVLSGTSLLTLDYNGNQLQRIPRTSFSVRPVAKLFGDRVRSELSIEHYGNRYADDANLQRLPAYTVLSADVRVRVSPALTLYLNSYNLLNAIGLTEGNLSTGPATATKNGLPVIIARSIPGRSAKLSVLYSF
jgi:outer membrane receptor protein involved in Fe transport